MSKRRMLYGYYIQQGEIAIVETEAIIVRRSHTARKCPCGTSIRSSVCWKIPAIWVKMDTLPSLTEWGFRRHNHIFMKRRQGMHPELSGQHCD